MTNQSIYDTALRLASEIAASDANADYQERSTYLLPIVCQRFAQTDRFYRLAMNREEQSLPSEIPYRLTDPFPLSDVFLSPASALLASLLVVEENPALSKHLEAVSNAAADAIRRDIPCRSESIQNSYA